MYNDLLDVIGYVKNVDPEIGDAMALELNRQQHKLELIASENKTSSLPPSWRRWAAC